MKHHIAASLALPIGVATLLWSAVLLIVYAPAEVFLWPAACHGLAVGGLAFWLWRSWLWVAAQALLPHLLGHMTCFAIVIHNGEGKPWMIALWTAGAAGVSFAGAGIGALIRAKREGPTPPDGSVSQ